MPPITSATPDSRWRRFIPRQFGLRSLLILTTLAACFIWWYIQLPAGTISQRQLSRIKNGMTKAELVASLGQPLKQQDVLASGWEYALASSWRKPSKESVIIVFDQHDQIEAILRIMHGEHVEFLVDP